MATVKPRDKQRGGLYFRSQWLRKAVETTELVETVSRAHPAPDLSNGIVFRPWALNSNAEVQTPKFKRRSS